MAHIPKRATQHCVFMPGYEIARPALKPGQDQLCRQNYYTAESKPLEETYIAQEIIKDSEYSKNIASRTLPEDYEDPQKPMRPPVVENKAGHLGTAHWRSEYSSTCNSEAIAGSVPHRQTGPPFEPVSVPTVVSAPNELSMYSKDFGEYGSDPRARLSRSDTKLPNPKHELTVGTTKGTMHIPGYQGFLPTNTNNPRVAAIEAGEHIRTVDKSNLYEIYHLNLPGYAGHVPGNGLNDRGPRQINSFSISGKELSAVAGFANDNI
eukprot:gnl/MRDRNA2_/MRDRNA2_29282_c0_seq1.p1 gnl/MRDRNA2_/MRDRNA2_29282_c0~~gnl/MRDRNA2_/MRDRNA2_29282_c0_seq1.p1  ORF type:complete len:264 (+),score=38.75 gnl/MRDRNA2_/MRDRNA2_29282_c0_seq1:84-875(+)